MADKWEDTTLGAFLDSEGGSILTGPFGTVLKASEYTATGVPVISVSEVGFGRIHLKAHTPRVDRSVTQRLSKYLLNPGDIVFARKGAGTAVERSALVSEQQGGWFLGSDGIRVRLPKNCSERFISYWLRSQRHRNWMKQHCVGTTMPALNEGIIRRIPICLPPLSEQKAIAAVLGALDDKIELNRRMNATLEAMARALFQSWFVDFDPVRAKQEGRLPAGLDEPTAALFPGKFQDSELGAIPSGWSIGSLQDLMAIEGGTQPPASEFISKPEPGYLRLVQIRDYQSDSHLTFVRDSSKLRKCRRDDVMIARYGASVARICWGLEGAYNVALVKAAPRKGCFREFLRSYLQSAEFQGRLIGMSNRSAQAGFNKGDIASFKIPIPTDELAEEYQAAAWKLREMVLHNNDESRALATLRDTLLPKLLNGQVALSPRKNEHC